VRVSATPHPSVPIVRFLGGARTVTGSRFLVETPSARVLVDCGLFQGEKELRLRNWRDFPVPPSSIDAVALTHAHVDHSGYLPALVKQGFEGPIFATRSTLELCRIVLPDSGHLQEEDAAYANRKGYSKHAPALPLYSEADALRALERFCAVAFDEEVEIAAGVSARFRRAGHILGSAAIALSIDGNPPRRLVVSGDLGRGNHPVLRPADPPPEADAILIESTYGDRLHPHPTAVVAFEEAILRTVARGGSVVIPAFAVDRTEVILLELKRLRREGRIPDLPIYVDSPMALAALGVYRNAVASRTDEVLAEFASADGDPFDPGRLIEAHGTAESRAINQQHFPCIIISASGMATGGRVLHHLANRLPDPRNTIVLPGFQASGTRGRSLQEGAHSIKLLGRYVPVRAEILDLPAFSVHADRDELLAWLASAEKPPEIVYVVHGEPEAAESLSNAIERELGVPSVVPRDGECVRLR
jgi:metallo-beta-lactamase family protein